MPCFTVICAFSLSWLYWSLTVVYLITIVSIVGVVLSENRNPVKSLAWVTVLLMFPIGGLVLYMFFGRSIKNKRMISRRNRRRLREHSRPRQVESSYRSLPPELRQLVELGRSTVGSVYLGGNDVEVFTSGADKFDSLLRDIRNARHFIHFQYYIFENDTLGQRIADELAAASARGVKVRVIYDHIGSYGVTGKFFRNLNARGVEAYPFFRVAFPPFATRINWRNHRKMVIIDGSIGYIGGMNIADRYISGGSFAKWRDCHLRITGPGVAALHYSFGVDWTFMGRPLFSETVSTRISTDTHAAGVQLLTSGPTSQWSAVAMQMLKAIGVARKRVYIQTPYFLPTEGLLRTLQTAALARVDVRVMIPWRSDSRILTYASYSYVMECLRAGIKIYLYKGGMLHSKTMVVDDEFSAVGSANIDFRSFEHNFESTLFIYSRKVNARLAEVFETDQKESERVAEAVWRHRPKTQKAKESIVRLLSPIL